MHKKHRDDTRPPFPIVFPGSDISPRDAIGVPSLARQSSMPRTGAESTVTRPTAPSAGRVSGELSSDPSANGGQNVCNGALLESWLLSGSGVVRHCTSRCADLHALNRCLRI